MCGIVGYVGRDEALPIVMEGLRRLEYRGYDSAGVAVVDGALTVRKRAGKERIGAGQRGHDGASDGGSLEAGSDSVGLAGIGFATPADLPTIRIQEIDGSVLRGAVLNMIEKRWVILPQNACHGCFQIFALVVARRYDCDPGWGIG
jgi:hypothetical protein